MRFAWFVALAGCNAVFGLDSTELAPEQPPPDTDGDTIADAVDNCVLAANTNQFDVDQDGIGDVCDNCPAVANFTQADVGDGDGVGDLCDAHPVDKGDCLVLYDSFADPGQFAMNWSTESSIGAPVVEPTAGRVHLVPNGNQSLLAMFALDGNGQRLAGIFDVQVRARFDHTGQPATQTEVGPLVESTLAMGPRCWMVSPAATQVPFIAIELNGSYVERSMSSRPFGALALVRYTSTDPDGQFHPMCRVDFGVGVGTIEMGQQPAPPTMYVGVGVTGLPVDVEGVAIYHFDPKVEACPAAVRR